MSDGTRTTLPDPNADLVGYTFVDDNGRTLRVLGTWAPIGAAYVEVADEGQFKSLRVAAQLRRSIQLSRQEGGTE